MKILFITILLLFSCSVFAQRINPAKRIQQAPDSNYLMLSDTNNEYRHTSQVELLATKPFVGSYEGEATVTVASDGVNVNLVITNTAGLMQVVFSDSVHIVADQNINLTAGTDSSPQINYVYIDAADDVLKTSTTAFPVTEYAPIATLVVQSAATAQDDGVYKFHAWTDHLKTTTSGHIGHINSWIRNQPASWISGVNWGTSINPASSPDDFWITTTSGEILQLHSHSFPSFADTTQFDYLFYNHPTAYTKANDLGDVLIDATGASLSNKYYSLVFWGIVSENNEDCHLMVNLPNGSYTTAAGVISDDDNYAVYGIPNDYLGTGFLIAELKVRYQPAAGGQFTMIDSIDLRGTIPGGTGTGGGAGASLTEFQDSDFLIYDNIDATKKLQFQISGVSSAATRTITVPDADGTLPLGTGSANWLTYWTGTNTISGESSLYWDSGNNRLGIGTSSPSETLDITGGFIITDGTNDLIQKFDYSGLGGTNADAFDIVYAPAGAYKMRTFTGLSSDGAAFQLFGGLSESVPGNLYFDFGSSSRDISGRKAYFRNTSLSGGTKVVLSLDENNDASFLGTGGLTIHSGTTAQRPTGAAGIIRYNSTTGKPEFHNGTSWFSFAATSSLYWTANGDEIENTNTGGIIITDGTNDLIQKFDYSGLGGTNADAFDIVYAPAGAYKMRTFTGLSSDGAAFQLFGGLSESVPGNLYFDFGSSSRDISGRKAYFRNTSLSGGTEVVLSLDENNDASFSGTGGLTIHSGTTAQRPTGAAGIIRYNSTTGLPEFHNGTSWISFGTGTGTITGATNLGTGLGLFSAVNGANLEFKSIKGGLNTLVTSDATSMTFTAQNDIYTVDNTLTGNRTATLGAYGLTFSSNTIGLDSFFVLDSPDPYLITHQARLMRTRMLIYYMTGII